MLLLMMMMVVVVVEEEEEEGEEGERKRGRKTVIWRAKIMYLARQISSARQRSMMGFYEHPWSSETLWAIPSYDRMKRESPTLPL